MLATAAVLTTGLTLARIMWLWDHRRVGPMLRQATRTLRETPWRTVTAAAFAVGSLIAYRRHGEAYHGRHRHEDLVAA